MNSFLGEVPRDLEELKDSSSTNDVTAVETDRCENLKLSMVVVPVVWETSCDARLTRDLLRLWLLRPLLFPSDKKSSPLMPLFEPGAERELKRLRDIASKLKIAARPRVLEVGVVGLDARSVRNLKSPHW